MLYEVMRLSRGRRRRCCSRKEDEFFLDEKIVQLPRLVHVDLDQRSEKWRFGKEV